MLEKCCKIASDLLEYVHARKTNAETLLLGGGL